MEEEKTLGVSGTNDAYKREMKPYEVYRVGNSKIELVRRLVNDKGEGRTLLPKAHHKKDFLEKNGWEVIYALRISHLDSTGEVVIPQTYNNFSHLTDLFRRGDERSMKMLSEIVANMDMALSDPLCGELEHFFALALNAMLNRHLSVVDKKAVYDKLKKAFCEYLDKDFLMYERVSAPKDMSEKEYRQAEIADEAREELKKQE